MTRRTIFDITVGAMFFTLWPLAIARADDQQLVQDYLSSRGINGAVLRPITDDYVGRAFPDFNFFGVIFPRYPIAILCPQTQDINCSNVFFVKNGQVDFVSTIEDLKFFFAAELPPVPSRDAATDAASAWLRFSEELKQDLFYAFSAPEISYMPRNDLARIEGHVSVTAGGKGQIDMVMMLVAGGFVNVYEKSALQSGVRPICQATRLLDRDPLVRRMAEQDLVVMGRAAKPYLDQIRATARPQLQHAIDRVWQRILNEGR